MPNTINKEWREWIITSFKNGCELDEIVSNMIDAGIDSELANAEVTKLKIQEISEILELRRKEKESKRIIYAFFKRLLYKLGIYRIKLLNIENAVSSPRFHHQWQPNIIRYETDAITDQALIRLRAMGHQGLSISRFSLGDANSIMMINGRLEGVSDPRNVGGTAGF